jgi:hypothetical protein
VSSFGRANSSRKSILDRPTMRVIATFWAIGQLNSCSWEFESRLLELRDGGGDVQQLVVMRKSSSQSIARIRSSDQIGSP